LFTPAAIRITIGPMGDSKLSAKMRSIYDEITSLTDEVCRTQLNEEYTELARELTALLASFSDSPLVRGKREIWACAILYALGQVNFLFDSSTAPYIGAKELCEAFGVKQSTASQKAALIRENLEMYQFDPRWCLPSLRDENPYNWMIQVDGLAVDARSAPRDIQQAAFEKGLIPHIPEDRRIDEIEAVDDEDFLRESLRMQEENSRDKKRKKKSKPVDPSQLSLDM